MSKSKLTMTEKEFKKRASFFINAIENTQLITAILRSFDISILSQIKQKINPLLDDIIEEKNKEKTILNEAKKEFLTKVKSLELSDGEIAELLGDFGVVKINKKTPAKAKYQAEITDKSGNKKTIKWSGRGNKPAFFKELPPEELQKYLIKQ